MAFNNPLSRTHIEHTSDRAQHYTNDLFVCDDCGHQYYPKVHSSTYVTDVISILVGALVVVLLLMKSSIWLYAVAGFIAMPYLYWYRKRERRVVALKGEEKIRYGDIVLDCPNCRSCNARKEKDS